MRRKRKMLIRLALAFVFVYHLQVYFGRTIEGPDLCPRHYLVHNGKFCAPASSPDFIGSDTPVYLSVYSALHDASRSEIYITMLVGRLNQPRIACRIKFANSDTYKNVRLGVVLSSHHLLDQNSRGELINTVTIACNYEDFKRTHIDVSPRCVQLVQRQNNSVVLANDVPVENIIHPTGRRSLALCLGRVYSEPYCPTCSGMNYTYHLPEWLEMQRLMGVQVVYVYNQSMSRDASTVFSHYARQGFVEILSHAPNHGESYMPVSLGVTDCIIRNQYQYDHILAMDTDEFLVPTKHDTYQQLIEEVFPKLSQKMHVQFSSAFFPIDRQWPAAEPYLKTQSYNYYYMVGHGYGKSIVNPRYCHIATAHTCKFITRPNSTFRVPPEVAMIHHYKDCKSQRRARNVQPCTDAKLMFNNATSRFRDRLNRAVLNSFHAIGLWEA